MLVLQSINFITVTRKSASVWKSRRETDYWTSRPPFVTEILIKYALSLSIKDRIVQGSSKGYSGQ